MADHTDISDEEKVLLNKYVLLLLYEDSTLVQKAAVPCEII